MRSCKKNTGEKMVITINKEIANDLYQKVKDNNPLLAFKSLSQSERKVFIIAMQVLRDKQERQVKSSNNIENITKKIGKLKQTHYYSFMLSIAKAIANLFGKKSSKDI